MINPKHLFSECGTFPVSLEIMDNLFCVNSDTFLVDVICNPTASFVVYDTICDGDIINFSNTSIDNNLDTNLFINSFSWNISNGNYVGSNNSSSLNPSFLFDNCGVYDVSLNIDLIYSDVVIVYIMKYLFIANPVAAFTSTDGCEDDTIQFISQNNTIQGLTIEFWNWTYALGVLSTEENPNEPIIFAGDSIEVSLSVTDHYGCFDDTTQYITVYRPPISNFSVIGNTICAQPVSLNTVSNNTVSFIADDLQNAPPSAPISNWIWDFGDNINNLSTNQADTVQNIYTLDPYVGGEYNIELMVVDTNNCKRKSEYILYIHPLPEVEFTTQRFVKDSSLYFSSSSSLFSPYHIS